jgi:hypothetical protein
MKTLSVKQPWVYLIFANIKPIENRTWPCPKKYIGERILIHASAKPDDRHRDMSLLFTKNQWEKITIEKLESYMSHGLWIYSAIIGSVEIVDCVLNHTSIWAEKTNFMLTGSGKQISMKSLVTIHGVQFVECYENDQRYSATELQEIINQ